MVRAAPAKKRRLSTMNGISSSLNEPMGLPALSDSSSASSSVRASSASASRRRASARSAGVVAAHAGKAARAAATARSTSALVELGAWAISWPVAGFRTLVVPPSAASANSPSMKFRSETVAVVLMRPKLPPPSLPARTTGFRKDRHLDQRRHLLRRADRDRLLRQGAWGRRADRSGRHGGHRRHRAGGSAARPDRERRLRQRHPHRDRRRLHGARGR